MPTRTEGEAAARVDRSEPIRYGCASGSRSNHPGARVLPAFGCADRAAHSASPLYRRCPLRRQSMLRERRHLTMRNARDIGLEGLELTEFRFEPRGSAPEIRDYFCPFSLVVNLRCGQGRSKYDFSIVAQWNLGRVQPRCCIFI